METIYFNVLNTNNDIILEDIKVFKPRNILKCMAYKHYTEYLAKSIFASTVTCLTSFSDDRVLVQQLAR